MRSITRLLLLLVAACGREPETPQQAQQREKAEQPPMPELDPPVETARDREDSGDAAATLKRYYARIEAGEYEAAWAMRSGESSDEAKRRFADNFKAYATYRADVGTPSEPVEAAGLGLCRGAGDDPGHLPRRQALQQRRQRHRPQSDVRAGGRRRMAHLHGRSPRPRRGRNLYLHARLVL